MSLKGIWSIGMMLLVIQGYAQSTFSGTYQGKINGDAARIELRQHGEEVSGKYQETGNAFDIRAKVIGAVCDGSLLITGTEISLASIRFQMTGTGLHLAVQLPDQTRVEADFVRLTGPSEKPVESLSQNKPLSTAQDALARDPAVVGQWRKEEIINSGTGDGAASMVTVYYLSLNADGSFLQEKSGGAGGSNWSSLSSRETDLTGHWYSQNQILYVRPTGEKEYFKLHQYLFHNGALVFKTDEGKYLIWNRQE